MLTNAAPWAPRSDIQAACSAQGILVVSGGQYQFFTAQYNDIWASFDGGYEWQALALQPSFSKRSYAATFIDPYTGFLNILGGQICWQYSLTQTNVGLCLNGNDVFRSTQSFNTIAAWGARQVPPLNVPACLGLSTWPSYPSFTPNPTMACTAAATSGYTNVNVFNMPATGNQSGFAPKWYFGIALQPNAQTVGGGFNIQAGDMIVYGGSESPQATNPGDAFLMRNNGANCQAGLRTLPCCLPHPSTLSPRCCCLPLPVRCCRLPRVRHRRPWRPVLRPERLRLELGPDHLLRPRQRSHVRAGRPVILQRELLVRRAGQTAAACAPPALPLA